MGKLEKKHCASIGQEKRKPEITAIGQQRIATIIFQKEVKKKDKDLEVGRISAKQLTTGRVVTKSPIHLPPPPHYHPLSLMNF